MKRLSLSVAAVLLLSSCSGQQASDTPKSAPSASASATATSAESSTPTASADPASFEGIESGSGKIAPGTYVLHYSSIGGAEAFPTLAITFTLPAGWDRVIVDGQAWNDKGMRIGFTTVDNLFVQPCQPELGVRDPAVGPSVDDLVTALGTVPGWTITESAFDTYFGFPGVRLALTGPDDIGSCPDGEPRLASAPGFPGFVTGAAEGERQELWILQVGTTRLVVHTLTDPQASAGALAELQSVTESVQITP
jgi:hypothetical protein